MLDKTKKPGTGGIKMLTEIMPGGDVEFGKFLNL